MNSQPVINLSNPPSCTLTQNVTANPTKFPGFDAYCTTTSDWVHTNIDINSFSTAGGNPVQVSIVYSGSNSTFFFAEIAFVTISVNIFQDSTVYQPATTTRNIYPIPNLIRNNTNIAVPIITQPNDYTTVVLFPSGAEGLITANPQVSVFVQSPPPAQSAVVITNLQVVTVKPPSLASLGVFTIAFVDLKQFGTKRNTFLIGFIFNVTGMLLVLRSFTECFHQNTI